jgi:hypothetical protein
LVVLSIGARFTFVQFVVFKSEFCCKVNITDGTVQEMTAVSPEEVRLKKGEGVVWEV